MHLKQEKMRKLSLLFTIFLVVQGKTQTKLINFKSHSGSAHHFSKTLLLNPSRFETSNFGVGPQRYVRNSNLDSVILLSEHTAIMVTSESCGFEDYNGRGQSLLKFGQLEETLLKIIRFSMVTIHSKQLKQYWRMITISRIRLKK